MLSPMMFCFRRVLLVVVAFTLLASPAGAQAWVQPERSQANLDALARVRLKTYAFEAAGNIQMEYRVYVPTGYDERTATPLVVALHGAGSDTVYMMEYNNLVELAESYGFIVATPMGYHPRGWYGARGPGNDFNRRREDPGPANLGELSEKDVLNVLAIVREDSWRGLIARGRRRQYRLAIVRDGLAETAVAAAEQVEAAHNDRRIYLIGQSMGGAGTFYLGSKYADIWAALVPMAPAVSGSPDSLEPALHLPVMVVMGDADQIVDVNVTRRWVAKMKELGMRYEYIEVPGGSHSSAGRENIDKVFAFLDTHRKH